MIDKKYLDDLASYLNNSVIEKRDADRFQLFHGSLNNDHLWVYRSGIVVTEESITIIRILRHFLEDHQIVTNEFRKIEEQFSQKQEEDKVTGWDETPKGIWLTPAQRRGLYEDLATIAEVQEYPPEKHEEWRMSINPGTVVMNSSGVVYTIGGFPNLLDLIRDQLEQYTKYPVDNLVAIHEQGRWSRLGPVILIIIELHVEDLKKLQIKGVKDSSISRNTTYSELEKIIEEKVKLSSLILTPTNLSDFTNRKQYLSYLRQQYHDFLVEKEIPANSYIEMDTQLKPLIGDIIDQEIHLRDRNKEISQLLGTAAYIGAMVHEQWADQQKEKYGIEIHRSNYHQIRQHPQSGRFVKKFLNL